MAANTAWQQPTGGGSCAGWGSGTRGHPRPPCLMRILRVAVARDHPHVGVLDLEPRGGQCHHVGRVVGQIFGGAQVDGDVALVA